MYVFFYKIYFTSTLIELFILKNIFLKAHKIWKNILKKTDLIYDNNFKKKALKIVLVFFELNEENFNGEKRNAKGIITLFFRIYFKIFTTVAKNSVYFKNLTL